VDRVKLGDLVVKKQRWSIDSNILGLVLGRGHAPSEWVVMWTLGTSEVQLKLHLESALLVVSDDVYIDVSRRTMNTGESCGGRK
jgi:hypothetical protein